MDSRQPHLINADCIPTMRAMTPGTIDLVIADPPYKLEMPARSGVDTLLAAKSITRVNEPWDKFDVDEYLEFSLEWIRAAVALLKPTGSIAITGTYHNIGFINVALQMSGVMIINDIAWYKRNAVPHLACRRLTASHESILWAAPTKRYRFNYEAMKAANDDAIHRRGKQMRSVWDIPTHSGERTAHPTQKPTAVYRRLIEMTTQPGDLVLDPFGGSGTLGMAARALDRRSIMIQRDLLYCGIIRDRLGLNDECIAA